MKTVRKKGIIVLGVLLAIALIFAGSAYSKGKGGMGMNPGGRGGMGGGIDGALDNPKAIEELGLTDEQITKIKEIRTGMMKERIQGQTNVKLLRMDLMDLLDKDNPDLGKADEIIEKIGKEETGMQKQMVHSMVKMQGVLTVEQKKKARQMFMGRMMGNMKGSGKGTGPDEKCPGMGQGMGMGGGKGQGMFTPEDE